MSFSRLRPAAETAYVSLGHRHAPRTTSRCPRVSHVFASTRLATSANSMKLLVRTAAAAASSIVRADRTHRLHRVAITVKVVRRYSRREVAKAVPRWAVLRTALLEAPLRPVVRLPAAGDRHWGAGARWSIAVVRFRRVVLVPPEVLLAPSPDLLLAPGVWFGHG